MMAKEFFKEIEDLAKDEDMKKYDNVTGPAHYLEGRIYEPRKVIEDWDLGFYLGNTVKYIARAGRKNDILEDLKKARQYLDWEIERIETKRKGGEKE